MSKQTCLADAKDITGTELIGKTVYFEALRTIRRGDDTRKIRGGGNKPYYDVIPGTVLEPTPRGVVIAAAGGMFNRILDDVIFPEDLDRWMRSNPDMLVLRGEA